MRHERKTHTLVAFDTFAVTSERVPKRFTLRQVSMPDQLPTTIPDRIGAEDDD